MENWREIKKAGTKGASKVLIQFVPAHLLRVGIPGRMICLEP